MGTGQYDVKMIRSRFIQIVTASTTHAEIMMFPWENVNLGDLQLALVDFAVLPEVLLHARFPFDAGEKIQDSDNFHPQVLGFIRACVLARRPCLLCGGPPRNGGRTIFTIPSTV